MELMTLGLLCAVTKLSTSSTPLSPTQARIQPSDKGGVVFLIFWLYTGKGRFLI